MQQNAFKNINKKSLTAILLTLIIIVIFFALLNPYLFKSYSTGNSTGTVGYTEKSWVLKKAGTDENKEITLPWHQKLESEKLYTISTTMTYDGLKDKTPYGFIHLDHMFCRIILDDQVLFSYMPDDSPKLSARKSPGFIYKAFAIPADTKGRELTIELMPKMALDIEYVFPEVTFSDLNDTITRAQYSYGPYNTSIVVCAMLGIFSILFSSIVLDGSRRREGFFVGVFSLVFSIYMLTECELNAFLMANPYQTYVTNYISFSLAPVFLIAFMRERLSQKVYRLLSVLMVGNIVLFTVEVIMHFLNIWDFREFIPVLHFVFVSEILLLIAFVFALKDGRRKVSLIEQLIPLFIGITIDMLTYWFHWNIGICDSTFTIVGVVFFLAIEIYHIFREGITVYEKSARSKLYQQLAYVDSLTGISNRRAYDEEIKRIESQPQDYHSMLVIAADVNKLKEVNDNFGHSEGDKLISGVADIMEQTFGTKGKVYRTGGDEFMAFIPDTEMSEYEEMLENVYRKADEFTAQNSFAMSIALGCEKIFDREILRATREADKKMYEQKERQRMVKTK